MDWNLLLSSNGSDFEDEEWDRAGNVAAMLAMDNSLTAAAATNESKKNEDLSSENDNDNSDSTNPISGTGKILWEGSNFYLQTGSLKLVFSCCSPLSVFHSRWIRKSFIRLLQKQIGMLHKRLRTGV